LEVRVLPPVDCLPPPRRELELLRASLFWGEEGQERRGLEGMDKVQAMDGDGQYDVLLGYECFLLCWWCIHKALTT